MRIRVAARHVTARIARKHLSAHPLAGTVQEADQGHLALILPFHPAPISHHRLIVPPTPIKSTMRGGATHDATFHDRANLLDGQWRIRSFFGRCRSAETVWLALQASEIVHAYRDQLM